jgi:hypothetical protein
MMKKLLIASLLLASPLFAQSVQQSGTVTRGHVPYWVTNGVIGDSGSSADSPITSLGVTNNGGAGICVSSDRFSVGASGLNKLCFGAQTAGPAFISLQNYGTAAAQNLQFIINGIPVTLPTGGGNFITGTAPFTAGDIPCFLNTAGVIVDCGIAAGGGVITSGVWAGTAIAVNNGGTGATTAATARTNLGLGSIATQNSNNVAITGGSITGLPTPSNPTDAAIKSYVDGVAQGLNILPQSTLATAAVLPNSPTYNNGSSGVGATLTAGSNTTLTVDGTAAPLNTVVLVKNQAAAAQNGIYTVTTAGSGSAPWVLTRATYFNTAAQMKAGSYTFVTAGTANTNNSFVLQTAVVTVGTDPLNWNLFAISAAGVSSIDGNTGTFTTGGGIISGGAAKVIQLANASTPVRQAILSGSVDANGTANFASGGSGLNVNLNASTPLNLSFADGFTTTGTVDFVAQEAANVTSFWASLPASQYSFLSIDRNGSTGALTATQTLMRPQKGPVFYAPRQALLHFEGNLVDDWGNTWSSVGASFTAPCAKFGSTGLRLNGSSSYAQSAQIFNPGQRNWTVDVWANLYNNVSANIFSVGNAFGMFIGTSASGKLQLWLSSGGASWDISGPTTGTTTVTASVFHHIALTFDGSNYRLFLDGNVEITVASSVVVWPDGVAMAIGAQVGETSTTAGCFDEFDFVPFARWVANFSPPASAYTVSGDWFDTNQMVMNTAVSAGPTWSIIQRQYVAEVATGASSVSAVYNYSITRQHTGADFSLDTTGRLRVGNRVIYAEGTPQFITSSTPGTPCITVPSCTIGSPVTWVMTPSQVPPDAKWFDIQINVFHAAIGGTNPGNQDCTLQSRIPIGTVQGFVALGAEYSNFTGFGTITNTSAFTESAGAVVRFPVLNGVAAFETSIGGGTCANGGTNNQARIVSGILIGYDLP